MALLIVSCVARQGLRCSQASNYRNPANDRQRTLQRPRDCPDPVGAHLENLGKTAWDPLLAAGAGTIPTVP